MTFNDSNKLVSLHFIRFYQKKDTKKYVKESKIGYDKLVAYASKQLNKKGETKIYYEKSNIQDYGQEWNETTTSLQIKNSISYNHSAIEFHCTYSGH